MHYIRTDLANTDLEFEECPDVGVESRKIQTGRFETVDEGVARLDGEVDVVEAHVIFEFGADLFGTI